MFVYDIHGNRLNGAEFPLLSDYGDIQTSEGFMAAFLLAVSDTDISGVSIPKGEYALSGALNMRSNFSVLGNGSKLTMLTTANTFNFNGVHDCVVENLVIDMNQTRASSAGTTFYIVDSSRITIENIETSNIGVRFCLAYPSDQTSNGVIDSIYIDNCMMEGIGEANTVQSEWPCGVIMANAKNSMISNCTVKGMSRFTLEYKNYSTNCWMLNNTIIGGEEGLALGGDRPSTESILANDISIIGNHVEGCKHALYYGRCKNLNVHGNILKGETVWIERSDGCHISGNDIEGDGATALNLINIHNSTNIVFDGNRYSKGANVGLYTIENGDDTIFIGGYMGNQKIDYQHST